MTLSKTYTGSILIAIAGILFWVLLMPAYDGIKAKREAVTQRDARIADQQAILDNIKALSDQYSQKADVIKRFQQVVPAMKSAPELISSIQALATQNGLQLANMNLGGGPDQNTTQYQEQPINLSLAGNYSSFKTFLISLEQNIRLIDILSISASPASDNSTIINFQITGKAYYLKQ
ncbi:MAG: type 4a pilus biogenesis protein PilO [Candidatus Pacebacteria bacterium]|nr:type 4a pilus biogenesis protein PilO [Candidatus Paceibacterota bacterium]